MIYLLLKIQKNQTKIQKIKYNKHKGHNNMEYPKETLTKNQEVRVLEEKGQYIKYTYIDPKTGKPIKQGKYSLLLKQQYSTYLE